MALTLWRGPRHDAGRIHQIFNWAAGGLFIAANVTSFVSLVSSELVELVVLVSVLAILPFLVPMQYGLGFGRPFSIRRGTEGLPVASPVPMSPMTSMPAFVAPVVPPGSPGFSAAPPPPPFAQGAPPAYDSPVGYYPPVYPPEVAQQQYAGVATSPAPEYSKGFGDKPS